MVQGQRSRAGRFLARSRAVAATARELGRRRRLLPKAWALLTSRSRRREQKQALSVNNPECLTPAWLVQTERHFAPDGIVLYHDEEQVLDPRFTWKAWRGSDRMALDANAYATPYSKLLRTNDYSPSSILEIGILNGSGLAVWSAAFPEAKLFGIDLSCRPVMENLPGLMDRGAFKRGAPKLLEMDVRRPDGRRIQQFIDSAGTLDLVIDDGPHTHEAIERMIFSLSPYLSPSFLYIIEDNPGALKLTASLLSSRADVYRLRGLVIADGRVRA